MGGQRMGRWPGDGWVAGAHALVIEIVSPYDDTWKKVPFYAKHGVDELLIVALRSVRHRRSTTG